MTVLFIVFWTMVGLAVGSFLNVVADRLPADESIAAPPSHCGACGRPLAAWEMIPVLSFLALRGQCCTCHMRIGLRVLWVELGTGGLFALAAWLHPVADWRAGANVVLTSVYLAVLVVVTVTDLEYGLILDAVIVPAMVLAVFGALVVDVQNWPLHLVSGIVGGGVIALIIALVPEGMGWGDAKLAALIGTVTGWPGVAFALFVGFVTGGIIAGALLATGRKARGQTIALGPFLAFGGALILLTGDAALRLFYALAQWV
jgi:leader peptidase (prepilin peptidase)/N-methyltransferase